MMMIRYCSLTVDSSEDKNAGQIIQMNRVLFAVSRDRSPRACKNSVQFLLLGS